jgi:hypothetical protein
MKFLSWVFNERDSAVEVHRSVTVVTFALNVAMVEQRLRPDSVVCLEEVKFLAFSGTVKINAVPGFVVAMAKGDKVRLIILAHSHSHIAGGLQNFSKDPDVSDFFIRASHMIRHRLKFFIANINFYH